MFWPYFAFRSVASWDCSPELSVRIRSWKFLYWSDPTTLPLPCTSGTWLVNLLASVRTLASETGSGVLNETCVPPLKSMPRLRPFVTSDPSPIATITPEIANHR